MKKPTKFVRFDIAYFIYSPGYYFDKYGRILRINNNTPQIGCPCCNAIFAENCYCGWIAIVPLIDLNPNTSQSVISLNNLI